MPERTVHCRICGKSVSGFDFAERMAKLRSHRKTEHPILHKRSIRKGVERRRKR